MNSSQGVDYHYLFKLLIIGNSSVGKSSLLIRFVENSYEDNYIATIGVDFKMKSIEHEEKRVKLQIWDTAGQDRFRNVTASYYRGASGIMIVYDITEPESFDCLNSWLIEIEKNATQNVYKILVGNKADLESKRKVSYDKGKEFAESHGMLFFETSAKSAQNVEQAFIEMTKDIVKQYNTKEKNLKGGSSKNIKIEAKKGQNLNKKEGGCC